jgi:putative sterol carrier protein
MAYKFPSQAWVEQLMVEINQSTGYAEAAKLWEGDVLMVVTGHGAHYLDLWHGQCRSALYLVDFSSKKAEFSLSAALNTWQQVLTGKLDPMQGMMKGQLKLDGNLAKVMQHLKAAQEMVRCAARVETVF